MSSRCTIDFETRSYADLGKVGAWVYSLHPSTEVICLCWKFSDSAEVGEWVPGMPPPASLIRWIRGGGLIEAHNYSFELAIWTNVCMPKYGFCSVLPSQWRCSMAVACYYAMPAKLESLCRALHIEGKDPAGGRLISKYSCLYLKTASPTIPPEDLRRFIDYCKIDVLREEAVSDYLGDLPDRELPHFQLDQEINMRGLFLDAEGIAAAAAIVDQRAEALTGRFRTLTGLNPTQNAKLLPWFAARGLALDNMQAAYIEDLLEEGAVPAGECREALTIRLQVNKASTKKLDAMARQRSPANSRALWQVRYHGAQTGRDTGGGFQPLNLTRGMEDVEPDQLVRDIMHGDAAWLDALYGDAMDAVSKASRHWIMAAPGHRILAGDFVSIEAVVLACLAGEDWKVDAFREGRKIYELMGDKIHGLAEGTVTKKSHPAERQDGKTGELAFQYGGGVGAWLNFDNSGRHTDERIDEIKKAWRAEHPMIVKFWRGLDDAALKAVANPADGIVQFRSIGFEIVDEWLSMILPNGKRIWYREPELRTGLPAWHKPETKEDCAAGSCDCRPMTKLTYMAQKEGQWRRVNTYGPKLAENGTQAVSREYLMPSVHAVKKAGYPVILKVYDEVVSEAPIGFGSKAEFIDILKNAPGRDWARTDDGQPWPIGVDAWEGLRYRK